MNKTDDILEKLKNANQPEIDMTEEIMNSLPLTSPRGGIEASRTLFFIRTVLSMAAVWLVGLFIVLQTESTGQEEIYNLENQYPSPQPEYCTEGTSREILMCYLERKRERQSIYSLIKQNLYENQ